MLSTDAEFWNGRFAGESYVFGTHPAAFLADNAHTIPPRSRVLVPADGEGRNSVFLAELGHRVVATDIAEQGIAKALKLAESRGVSVEWTLHQSPRRGMDVYFVVRTRSKKSKLSGKTSGTIPG